MRRSFQPGAALCAAAVCIAFSGCCSGLAPCFKPKCSSAWTCARWDAASEASVARGEISYEANAAPSLAEVNLALGGPPTAEYIAMGAPGVQCLAAQNASVPNLINREIALLEYMADESSARKRRVYLIQRDLTQLRGVTRRNEAAANALNLYWQISNVEFQRMILERTLVDVRRSISDFEELRARQQPVPPDETTIKVQEVELQDQLTTLEKTTDQLNGQLRVLFGSVPADGPYIWPETPLSVTVAPIDVDAAISVGLATRADLMSLRLVIATLDSDSLPLARAALQQSDGVLGAAQTKLRALDCDQVEREVVIRNEQLGMLLADSERAVAEQIRQAVIAVDAALRAVALANQGVAIRRQRQSDVDQLREAGVAGVTSFDLTAARVEVLKAESLLVKQIVAWKTAEVELKEAQGLLASECGYPAVACHFQHCLNDCGSCGDGSCESCSGEHVSHEAGPAAPAPTNLPPPESEEPQYDAPKADEVPPPTEAHNGLKTTPHSWPTEIVEAPRGGKRPSRERNEAENAVTSRRGTPVSEAGYSPPPVVAEAPPVPEKPAKSRVMSAPTSAFGAEKW